MHGNADAAAHHNATDERHIGFRKMLDRGIQTVLVAVEGARVRRSGLAGIIQRSDIATSAEGSLASTPNHDTADERIALPRLELRTHETTHFVCQRIQRLWPVERYEADGASALE